VFPLLRRLVLGEDRLHRQTGSQAPQSMHSSGWMKSWVGPS
jgi:hypothetical protein